MTGKQLVPDDPEYRRVFQPRQASLTERVGDGLEGYFTGTHKGRFWPQLVASAAKAFLMCWVIVALGLAFHPYFGFMGPFRPMLPTVLRNGTGSDLEVLQSVGRWLLVVLWHWNLFLALFVPWMCWRTYTLTREALPKYFRERSQRRAAAAMEREQIRRDYEAGIARQLGAAEVARKAKEAEREAQARAERQARDEEIASLRNHIRIRTEIRTKLENSIHAAIARARLDAVVNGDPEPTETAYRRVGDAMRKEQPKPREWGLLRDRDVSDIAIKRVIGDGSWLPEAPPYPDGFAASQLN